MQESKNKFVVKPRKRYSESSVISARLPVDLIKELDNIAGKTCRTRNELILMSIEYAIDNLEIAAENQ